MAVILLNSQSQLIETVLLLQLQLLALTVVAMVVPYARLDPAVVRVARVGEVHEPLRVTRGSAGVRMQRAVGGDTSTSGLGDSLGIDVLQYLTRGGCPSGTAL